MKFLAKSGVCPFCRSSGNRGDEIVKKVDDNDNDLFK